MNVALISIALVMLRPVSIDAQGITLYSNRNPPHTDITSANIRRAVIEYVEDPEYAIRKYGLIDHWDTSEVTDMSFLFFYGRCPQNVLQELCTDALKNFNEDLSLWDTSQVTSMDSMFFNCEKFNKDISAWNVAKVEIIDRIFYNAQDFNADVGRWNVTSVKKLDHAFKGANSFIHDLSSWTVG